MWAHADWLVDKLSDLDTWRDMPASKLIARACSWVDGFFNLALLILLQTGPFDKFWVELMQISNLLVCNDNHSRLFFNVVETHPKPNPPNNKPGDGKALLFTLQFTYFYECRHEG